MNFALSALLSLGLLSTVAPNVLAASKTVSVIGGLGSATISADNGQFAMTGNAGFSDCFVLKQTVVKPTSWRQFTTSGWVTKASYDFQLDHNYNIDPLRCGNNATFQRISGTVVDVGFQLRTATVVLNYPVLPRQEVDAGVYYSSETGTDEIQVGKTLYTLKKGGKGGKSCLSLGKAWNSCKFLQVTTFGTPATQRIDSLMKLKASLKDLDSAPKVAVYYKALNPDLQSVDVGTDNGQTWFVRTTTFATPSAASKVQLQSVSRSDWTISPIY
jgi:hypothetical protein